MTTGDATLVAVVAPLGLAIIGVLYRAGTIMGKVGEQLGDHERRLNRLESPEASRRGWTGTEHL